MLFYFLITIVFIAEMIIALAVIYWLYKSSKIFKEANEFLDLAKPNIKEIAKLCTGMSEQLLSFAPIIVKKVKSVFWNIVSNQIKSVIAGVTFWAVKTEVEKHVTK